MAKRRANGEGNLRKRKDGRWEGRYTAGRAPETGRVIYKNVLGKTQAEAKAKRRVLQKKIANLEELAAKPTPPKGKPVNMDDITELQYELADLEREAVNPLRLLADDTTPEALASLMAANDGRMGIVSDEGGVFDILAGKYSNGKANLDVFLKAYSGAPIRIDRKGRPPESIDHSALTMLLMVQPAVLEAIMGNQDFAGRGFLARPLYSLPLSTVGHRVYESAPTAQSGVYSGHRAAYTARPPRPARPGPQSGRATERRPGRGYPGGRGGRSGGGRRYRGGRGPQ